MASAVPASNSRGVPTRHRAVRYGVYALLCAGFCWALYSLGWQGWASYQYREALASAARHDYAQAGAHVEKYLLIRSWDWEGWMLAARTARQQGDFDHAAVFLREAKKQGAPDAAIDLERQLLDIQIGDARAADELLGFCAANPYRAETPLMLQAIAAGALRHQDAARARKAANLWLKSADSPADQAEGHLWLGQADNLANDAGSAADHFQQAIELVPDHHMARLMFAATLVHDQPSRARPHLERLRRERPTDADVLFQVARMHRYLGEADQAAALLDQLLQKSPANAQLLVERGRLWLDQMRPEEAEPLLRRALRIAPKERQVHASLADCLRQQGKVEDAKVFQTLADEIEKASVPAPGAAKKS